MHIYQIPKDIIEYIIRITTDYGSTYKSIIFTSRYFKQLTYHLFPEADVKFCNHLATLYKLYPEGSIINYRGNNNKDEIIEYDICGLSYNPNITWEMIKSFPYHKRYYHWY